jgi:hypothetical protein
MLPCCWIGDREVFGSYPNEIFMFGKSTRKVLQTPVRCCTRKPLEAESSLLTATSFYMISGYSDILIRTFIFREMVVFFSMLLIGPCVFVLKQGH